MKEWLSIIARVLAMFALAYVIGSVAAAVRYDAPLHRCLLNPGCGVEGHDFGGSLRW